MAILEFLLWQRPDSGAVAKSGMFTNMSVMEVFLWQMLRLRRFYSMFINVSISSLKRPINPCQEYINKEFETPFSHVEHHPIRDYFES